MSRVIKRGDAHVSKPVQVICPKCMSVVEFERSDIYSDQRDGDYVKCPVCCRFIAAKVIWGRP